MAAIIEDNRTTLQISATVNKELLAVSDKLFTPAGFLKVPKGTYSALISQLLTRYLEDQFGTDIISILELNTKHPEMSVQEMKEFFSANKQKGN
jgi:hypothetical protein